MGLDGGLTTDEFRNEHLREFGDVGENVRRSRNAECVLDEGGLMCLMRSTIKVAEVPRALVDVALDKGSRSRRRRHYGVSRTTDFLSRLFWRHRQCKDVEERFDAA